MNANAAGLWIFLSMARKENEKCISLPSVPEDQPSLCSGGAGKLTWFAALDIEVVWPEIFHALEGSWHVSNVECGGLLVYDIRCDVFQSGIVDVSSNQLTA